MSNNINRFTRRSQDSTPLSPLSGNPFSFASITYPEEIFNLSHALLFNINVNQSSKDMESGRETADIISIGPSEEIQRESRTSTSTKGLPGLTRRTKRVLRAIALYVPDTVVFDNRQEYQSPSLLDTLGVGGTAIAGAVSSLQSVSGLPGTTALAAGGIAAAGSFFSAALGRGSRAIGDVLGRINNSAGPMRTGAQVTGFALNPIIEVLYSAPSLRTFNFDFNFIAKSPSEADKIWQIIYEFRRHSAPEFIDATAGVFLLPPSDFDITFLRKESSGNFIENTNMPRISTCVLEDVQVDYAASGQFVTFADGMPVQIRMRLQFKELNIITRERVDEGY